MDMFLGVAHAFPARPEAVAGFTSSDLILECRRKKWPLLIVNNFCDSEVLRFVQANSGDLGLVLGAAGLGNDIPILPRHGSLSVQFTASTSEGEIASPGKQAGSRMPVEVRIVVQSISEANGASPVVSVQLPIQFYDTRAGNAVKAELIANDLLLQAIKAYSIGNMASAPEEVDVWVKEMLPAHPEPNQPVLSRSAQDPQIWRTRPPWKLCLHTLLLFSPYIIARNWYRRWRGQFPVVILFHHLISDRPHRMGMPTENFLRQARFLLRYYHVVPISEAIEILQSGSVKAPTVVLTFDDGYEDNFLNLRAVAEATRLPVTMFVCSSPVAAREEFRHDQKNGPTGFRALSWEQIRYWQSDRTQFGSHTRTHFDCGSSDLVALTDELAGSRNDMESHLGRPVPFFAFPWGKAKNMSSIAIGVATSTYEWCFSTLEIENFATAGTDCRIAGRKAQPANTWELELALQSIFEIAQRLTRKT